MFVIYHELIHRSQWTGQSDLKTCANTILSAATCSGMVRTPSLLYCHSLVLTRVQLRWNQMHVAQVPQVHKNSNSRKDFCLLRTLVQSRCTSLKLKIDWSSWILRNNLKSYWNIILISCNLFWLIPVNETRSYIFLKYEGNSNIKEYLYFIVIY